MSMKPGWMILSSCLALSLLNGGRVLAQEPQPVDDAPAQDTGSVDVVPSPTDAACGPAHADDPPPSPACDAEDARYAQLVRERLEKEKPTHSRFPKWLHTDVLWIPSQTGVHSYGLIGAHIVVINIDRVYVFGPPGIMLVLDDIGSERRLRPAFTWGMSVLVGNLTVPGLQRTAQFYVNLTKSWTMGNFQTGLDMVGLSVSWKK